MERKKMEAWTRWRAAMGKVTLLWRFYSRPEADLSYFQYMQLNVSQLKAEA